MHTKRRAFHPEQRGKIDPVPHLFSHLTAFPGNKEPFQELHIHFDPEVRLSAALLAIGWRLLGLILLVVKEGHCACCTFCTTSVIVKREMNKERMIYSVLQTTARLHH